MTRRLLCITTVIAAALLALAIGLWLQTSANRPAKSVALANGTVLPTPYGITPFKLTNTQGKIFNNKNLRGHWTLIFFGFTHCPMICPTTLSELNKAYQQLKVEDRKSLPKILFVSIDPERDTAPVIKSYLANFNKNFSGVTGNKEELDSLTKQLGIAYMKATKSNEKNYNIEHSGSILVVNPNGEWVAVLSSPKNGNTIAEDFMRIQKR